MLYSEYQPTKIEFIDRNNEPILSYIQTVSSFCLKELKFCHVTASDNTKYAFE